MKYETWQISHHSSGKFWGATEYLRGSPVFPDGMFQLGIGVPLNPALIPVFQVFAAMFWLKELIRANGTNVNTIPKNEIEHES